MSELLEESRETVAIIINNLSNGYEKKIKEVKNKKRRNMSEEVYI